MVVRNKMYWNVTVHYLSLGIKSLHVCSYILLEGETNAKYHSATLRTFYDSFIDESCLEISLGYKFMNTQQYNILILAWSPLPENASSVWVWDSCECTIIGIIVLCYHNTVLGPALNGVPTTTDEGG